MVQNIPRAKRLTPELADTVFWTNLAMSVAVAFVVLGLAPLIMTLIEQPDATGPLQALGFVLPIAAMGATHMSLRLREFGHKTLALRSVVGGTIGGAAAIGAAFAGWGIWSLVVQRFVTESLNGGLSEIRMSGEVLEATLAIRAFLFEAVYENDRATAEFKKSAGILGGLWEKVREHPGELLDLHIIEREGVDVAVRDFLAGMTDRFAIALYERLFIPKPWIGPMTWNQL